MLLFEKAELVQEQAKGHVRHCFTTDRRLAIAVATA